MKSVVYNRQNAWGDLGTFLALLVPLKGALESFLDHQSLTVLNACVSGL